MSNGFLAATASVAEARFEVCPNFAKGTCACPVIYDDAGDRVAPPHRVFAFPARSPDPKDKRSPAEWQDACAGEIALLLAAEATPEPAILDKWQGKAL